MSGAPFRCFPLGFANGFTHKHYAKLKRPARDKQYSFLVRLINYGRKSFVTLVPDALKFFLFLYQPPLKFLANLAELNLGPQMFILLLLQGGFSFFKGNL